jgi:hypothetical protein
MKTFAEGTFAAALEHRRFANDERWRSTTQEKRSKSDMQRPAKLLDMCDCEELEFEDFQIMLAAIFKASRLHTEEVPIKAPLPQLVLARQTK